MSAFGGCGVVESWTGHNETMWVIHPVGEVQKAAAISYVRRSHQGDPVGAAEILAALGLDYAA